MTTLLHSSTDLIETMRREIEDVRRHNAALQAQNDAYRYSHLGILSGPAVRYELAQLTEPCDLIAFDWRKLHEWNDILGRSPSNVFFGNLARADYAGVDRRHAARALDLRGQWDGDEILMAVDAGCGHGLFTRLLRELVTMNHEMSTSHRAAITQRTGGLIDGFCIAAVLVECSTRPLRDAERAIDATGVLKAGNVTGTRALSGARGTVLGRMVRG